MTFKFFIGLTSLVLWLFFATPLALAEAVESIPQPEVKKVAPTVSALITRYAALYGVSEVKMKNTLWCESQYRSIQSLIPNPTGPNGREDSWGVAQIHLPDHPEVTKAQALNNEFAVEWTAKKFSQGKQAIWTCYRDLYL